MGFVVRASERKTTGSGESAQIARRRHLETQPASAVLFLLVHSVWQKVYRICCNSSVVILLFFGCWPCKLDYMSERFSTWEAMRRHDKTIFVAHENHSVEHNRVISNHSRTPLSYEDVVQRHHYFRRTAVAQFGRSRGGRRSVQRRNEPFNHL